MLKELAEKAQDQLTIGYVGLDNLQDAFLIGNSKNHDIPQTIDSFQRYGFGDPMKYDPSLNGGEGGLVEGNGRLEALMTMRDRGDKPPRGITEDWKAPIVFGVNAVSESEAIAYSIEHNLAPTWATDIDWQTTMSMFHEDVLAEQMEKLKTEESLPLSFSGDDLNDVLEHLAVTEPEPKKDYEQIETEKQPEQKNEEWTTWKLKFPNDAKEVITRVIDIVGSEKDLHKDKAIALGQVIEILAAEYLAGFS